MGSLRYRPDRERWQLDYIDAAGRRRRPFCAPGATHDQAVAELVAVETSLRAKVRNRRTRVATPPPTDTAALADTVKPWWALNTLEQIDARIETLRRKRLQLICANLVAQHAKKLNELAAANAVTLPTLTEALITSLRAHAERQA